MAILFKLAYNNQSDFLFTLDQRMFKIDIVIYHFLFKIFVFFAMKLKVRREQGKRFMWHAFVNIESEKAW